MTTREDSLLSYDNALSTPLIHRYPGNSILTRKHWPYSVNSVFNAGATLLEDGTTLLLCRIEDRRGLSHPPDLGYVVEGCCRKWNAVGMPGVFMGPDWAFGMVSSVFDSGNHVSFERLAGISEVFHAFRSGIGIAGEPLRATGLSGAGLIPVISIFVKAGIIQPVC